MALLWMDGFENMVTADLAKRYTNYAVATIGAVGRDGSNGLHAYGSGVSPGYIWKAGLPASGATAIIGAWVHTDGSVYGSNEMLFGFRLNAVEQICVTPDGIGRLEVRRGSWNGTVLGTSTNALGLGTTHYIEFKCTIDSSAGTYEVRVDGANWVSGTGVNTQGAGSATWNEFLVGYGSAWYSLAMDVDDLYVLDGSGSAPLNDFLGQVRVDTHYATADGGVNDWTASAGSRYACVDEATPNDDTDYVSATTVNNRQTFVVEDLKNPGGTMLAVEVEFAARRLPSGFASVGPLIRRAGSNYDGTGQTLSETFQFYRQHYPTDPSTSAAWTEANFNASEFGVVKSA